MSCSITHLLHTVTSYSTKKIPKNEFPLIIYENKAQSSLTMILSENLLISSCNQLIVQTTELDPQLL